MRALHLLLLGLCLLLFTRLATTDLALPGPQDDEIKHGALAVDLLRPPFPHSRDYALRLGDQPFPFGITPHAGALKSYLLWPFFALFKPSVEIVRIFTIFLGLLVLVFSYLFLLEHAGRWPAFFAVLLLSLDASFIFYSKLDEGPIIEQLLWFVVCLWTFGRFGRTRQMGYFVVGLVASIFGIYSHITFIWFVVACCLALPLCFPQELRTLSKRSTLTLAIPAALCVLIVFLYWYIGERGRFLVDEPHGLSGILVMFERLSTMGGIVPEVLFGRSTNRNLPVLGIETRPLTDIFLIASVAFLLCCGGMKSKFLRFLFLTSAIYLVEVSVTPKGLNMLRYHRMMPFYIFLIFLAGIAISQNGKILKHFRNEFPGSVIVSFVIFFLAVTSIGGQVSLTQEAIREIRQTGGKGFWSDSIYAVAETLKGKKWETTVCLDWGYTSLVLLGKGKIPLSKPTWNIYTVNEETKLQILSQMIRGASPQVLFLLNLMKKPRGGVTVQEFQEVTQRVDKKLEREYVFYDRKGELLYAAYTVHAK